MAHVRDRGELPFLHAAEGNTAAVALYTSMGCRLRRTLTFLSAVAPDGKA